MGPVLTRLKSLLGTPWLRHAELIWYPNDVMSRTQTPLERALIQKLLSLPFPGRDELAEQAATALVRTGNDPLDRSVLLSVDPSLPGSPGLYRVPVDASAADSDGMRIDFLMHVGDDGRLLEVEIYRVDGEPLLQMPDPEALEVVTYPVQG